MEAFSAALGGGGRLHGVVFSKKKKMGGKFGKNSMSHKKIHPTRAMMMEDDDDDDDDFYVRYYVVRHVFRSRGGGFF